MRRFFVLAMCAGLAMVLAIGSLAQPPGPPRPRGKDDRRGPGRELHPPPPPPDRLMEAIDADHDGTISADEIAKAGDAIKKLDRDGDGKISHEELRPPRPPRGPDGGPGEHGPPRGPRGDGPDGRHRSDGPPPRHEDGGPRRPPGPPPGPPHDGPQAGGPPLLPPFVRDELELTDDQEKQLDQLRDEVRGKIEKILTEEQREQLPKLLRRGPGGPPDGPPRGPRRGPPPRDEDEEDFGPPERP